MKKKSLGEVYWDAKIKKMANNVFTNIDNWKDLTLRARKEIETGAKAVAREVRKRDKQKYNMQFQNEVTR